MAGGATSTRWTEAAAKSASVYTGLASPIASIQLRIIGRFTGSRPWRGRLWPAAATRWASSRIAPAWAVATASVAVICPSPACRYAGQLRPWSARHPGQPEPGGRDELTLDLVDPAAERQHRVAFRLDVQPPAEFGGPRVGRVAVTADDLLQFL